MIIIEISPFFEKLFVFCKLFVVITILVGVCKVGITYLSNYYKALILIPALFFTLVIGNIYGQFKDIEENLVLLNSGNTQTKSGILKLVEVVSTEGMGGEHERYSEVEVIQFSDNKLVRFNPRIVSGGAGCVSGYLGDELADYYSKKVSITYIEKGFNKPCVLRVEAID